MLAFQAVVEDSYHEREKTDEDSAEPGSGPCAIEHVIEFSAGPLDQESDDGTKQRAEKDSEEGYAESLSHPTVTGHQSVDVQ